jgi:putative transposase
VVAPYCGCPILWLPHIVVAPYCGCPILWLPHIGNFIMTFNPKIHKRRSIRLKGYDYSQTGLYFITICTQNKECFFGDITGGEMVLNNVGIMVENQWLNLQNRYQYIELHEYIVMPNHIHGIIQIVGGQPQRITPTVGDIVGAFKSLVTNEYIRNVKQNNWQRFNGKLWQRNYYEHIIRDEKSFLQIAEYIQTNPLKWQDDKYHI